MRLSEFSGPNPQYTDVISIHQNSFREGPRYVAIAHSHTPVPSFQVPHFGCNIRRLRHFVSRKVRAMVFLWWMFVGVSDLVRGLRGDFLEGGREIRD